LENAKIIKLQVFERCFFFKKNFDKTELGSSTQKEKKKKRKIIGVILTEIQYIVASLINLN